MKGHEAEEEDYPKSGVIGAVALDINPEPRLLLNEYGERM